ncbi:hypothetical protein K488DRAFT_75724 [Vararia minispora EC-137]|uniref:Uncharacterized protein n=1 Tax=Vararia minispora EC-137 TaxID=1314806 RepID=A0ACB8QZI3_9AGAM|nr:hypothetical protein K488DRAFT_75724 [Vararia minispora EC-137]
MAFHLSRSMPSTPPADDHDPDLSRSSHPSDVDSLATALHNALADVSGSLSTDAHPPEHDMGPKLSSSIEIVLASDLLTLRGVGVDVAPTLLTGHVVLNLAEATSIKAITLQFRGKARLPAPASESMSLNNSAMTYIVCNHEWSFLEGEKKHSHTLKPGRHLFPFQLRIGGSLPSSISTPVFGGASITYKLRAVAIRPGLSHNFHAQIPVYISRSFAPEALEYQQTLEIENTWPDKLMYSIMIPHKAWAAGDTLTAVVKFSPLAKGSRVTSVGTQVNETTKLYARNGWQEATKTIVSSKHEIVGGDAVCVEHQSPCSPRPRSSSGPHALHALHSVPTTPGARSVATTPSYEGSWNGHHPRHSTSSLHQASYFTALPGSVHPPEESPIAGPSTSSLSEHHSHSSHAHVPVDFEVSDQDVVTTLEITVPPSATPTHNLEPVIISHRIRWSILISNLDGHTSELRCSLPLHILDNCLIDEALSATAATRRLLLGGPEVPEPSADDIELPSYSSHVRDRVANMYLPEQAVLRVTNPWVQHGISPVQLDGSQPVSGLATPLEAHSLPTHHPTHHPANLEYVNSELLLSLSSEAPPTLDRFPAHSPEHTSPTTSAGPSARGSRAASRSASRAGSRAGSRAASPERDAHSNASDSPSIASTTSTYVHAHSSASRNLHGVFQNSMKPFTSLASPFRHHHAHTPTSIPGTPRNGVNAPTPVQIIRSPPQANTPVSLLHRAFTEVPDYGVASRGFLGGITPIESMQGLPSYEDSQTAARTDGGVFGAPLPFPGVNWSVTPAADMP